MAGDISIPAEVDRLASAVRSIGPLTSALFNAGNMVRGTALEVTPEQFESTWRGSAYAGFLFVRAALPLFGFRRRQSPVDRRNRVGARWWPIHRLRLGQGSPALHSSERCSRIWTPAYTLRMLLLTAVSMANGCGAIAPNHVEQAGENGLLDPDAIADTYWHLHEQPRSAWTHEVDLRPFKERF